MSQGENEKNLPLLLTFITFYRLLWLALIIKQMTRHTRAALKSRKLYIMNKLEI